MSFLPLRSPTGLIAGLAAMLLLAAGTAAATAGVVATTTPPAVSTAGFPAGGTNPGIFTDTCGRAKTAPDDPIMMPGMTGRSMQHDFFGNRAVNASSTAGSLLGGATTCSTTADASAYWTPVVFQDGRALTPSRTLIYWRAPAAIASATRTMPAGISLIAGTRRRRRRSPSRSSTGPARSHGPSRVPRDPICRTIAHRGRSCAW